MDYKIVLLYSYVNIWLVYSFLGKIRAYIIQNKANLFDEKRVNLFDDAISDKMLWMSKIKDHLNQLIT